MAARKSSGSKKSASKKKSSGKKRSASKKKSVPSNALALLQADHREVQDLFDKFEKTRSDERKAALAEQICNELTIHAQIEEEIFYPAAREAIRDKDLLEEATVEHQSAKDLIAQIEGSSPGEELFDAKVKVLGEYVKHHVKEEQGELFAQVRKTKLDLKALGEQLMARKQELMAGGGSSRGGGSRGRSRSASRGSSMQGSAGSSSQTEEGAAVARNAGEREGIVAMVARGMGLGGT
jgi:hypothetical protein